MNKNQIDNTLNGPSPDAPDLGTVPGFIKMVDAILNGASYSASEILKLKNSHEYGEISNYLISPSVLDRLDKLLIEDRLDGSQLEQLLFIFLTCRRYDMKLCGHYDMNKTFIRAFNKYVDLMRSGSTPDNINVLLHSIIFINGSKANEIYNRQIFQRFSTQTLDIDLNLVDEGIRKYLSGLLINTMLSRLSSNENSRWTFSDNRENIITLIENLRRLEAESSFDDTISAISLYYEYLDSGRAASARKANGAIIKLEQSQSSHFDILAPDMVLNLLQMPVRHQDKFIRGLKFNSIFWSGFMGKINELLPDNKTNTAVLVRHIAFYYKFKPQITNPEVSYKIEDRILKKLAEMSESRKNRWLITKIRLMLKIRYGIWIEINRKTPA